MVKEYFLFPLKGAILYCETVVLPTHPSNQLRHLLQRLHYSCKAENKNEKKTMTWSN